MFCSLRAAAQSSWTLQLWRRYLWIGVWKVNASHASRARQKLENQRSAQAIASRAKVHRMSCALKGTAFTPVPDSQVVKETNEAAKKSETGSEAWGPFFPIPELKFNKCDLDFHHGNGDEHWPIYGRDVKYLFLRCWVSTSTQFFVRDFFPRHSPASLSAS